MMRLVLSTFLAAALVFFGALLFAGYFEGIEVRDAELNEEGSQPPPDGDPQRVVWHCPDVEDILEGPLPEIFDPIQSRISSMNKDFTFLGATLTGTYEINQRTATADGINCTYWLGIVEEPFSDAGLALISSLDVEIAFDGTSWTTHVPGQPFCWGPMTDNCGFQVMPTE